MKLIFYLCLIFCTALIIGCSDNSSTTSTDTNSVSIRSVNDTLAISLFTANHNYNDTIQLAFSADTVNLMMSVSGYGRGTGFFKVFRDTTTVILKDLGSNYSSSERIFTGIPTKAVLQLLSYKGNASILLSK
jgi:hypothetical protein